MSSFDEFWDKFAIGLNADENEAQSIWESGAQSRQAELDQAYADIETFAKGMEREAELKNQFCSERDELKKRIDRVIQAVETFDGCDDISFVIKILKGNQS